MPDNFMNNSGASVSPLIESKKDLEKLVVIYDDICDYDLAIEKILYAKEWEGEREELTKANH
jgi:peptidyl-tRNA hydrolase